MSDRDQVIAEQAAEKAVENVLQRLGLDVSDPKALQADLAYVRNQRQISEKITVSVRITLITTFISGFVGMAYMGIKQVLGHG